MTLRSTMRRGALHFALIATVLLSGCAHNNPRDPFEPLNRGIYQFNDVVDKAVLKPVAGAYKDVIPEPIRTAIKNVFANIEDLWIGLNNFLQGKVPEGINDFGRFAVNSTLGVLGVMDVATKLGVEKHNEDFGQTLGRWGLGDGPYLVIPFFGPSNLRDTVGLYVDYKFDPVINSIGHVRTRNPVLGLRIVSKRAGLLEASKILDEASLDEYSFVRDAYMQRRRNLVFDGNAPPEADEMDDQKSKPRTEGVSTEPRAAAADAMPLAATSTDGRMDDKPQAAALPAPAASVAIAGNADQVSGDGGSGEAASRPRVMRVWLPNP